MPIIHLETIIKADQKIVFDLARIIQIVGKIVCIIPSALSELDNLVSIIQKMEYNHIYL